jgi:excisionase family DNA binding protein
MGGEKQPGVLRLLTAAEVCEIFGISRNTLRRWVAARKIHHVKIGREHRFVQAAIEKMIERKTVKAL